MTFLSHLLIDMGDNPDRPRPGRLWIRNTYHVHQRLSMAFPSRNLKQADPHFLKPFDPNRFDRPHFLFRIDRGLIKGRDDDRLVRAVILVQSEDKPDWDYAFQNAPGLLAAPVDTREIRLDAPVGARYRFRLVANPSKKERGRGKDPLGKNRGRLGLYSREDQIAWLQRKAENGGFCTEKVELEVLGKRSCLKAGAESRDEHGRKISLTHLGVKYDGILEVKDSMKFAEIRSVGIGPAKAFGFGLLSVAPID